MGMRGGFPEELDKLEWKFGRRRMASIRRILSRWAEWREIRLSGRGLRLPEEKYRWGINPIGGFEVLAIGACWERSTKPPPDFSDLEDFGLAFNTLSERDQTIVLVARFGGKSEWETTVKLLNISKDNLEIELRIAMLRLGLACQKRGLV